MDSIRRLVTSDESNPTY